MTEAKVVNGDAPEDKKDAIEAFKRDSHLLRDRADGSVWQRYMIAVTLGMSKADCAAYADIGSSTVRNWIVEAGEAEEAGVGNVFTEFATAVRSNRATMIARNIGTIEKARKGNDWKAAAWLLERHGYNKTTEIEGNVNATLTYTIDQQDTEA